MKIRVFLAAVAATLCVCACGTASSAASADSETPANAITPQTDPLVLEIDSFEGRTLSGDRNYITIVNNTVQGRIGLANGMTRPGLLLGVNALTFDKSEAVVYEPKVSKKGTSYSFTVKAMDARFLTSMRDTDWRLMITVYSNGTASIDIESASIAQVYNSRIWHFYGRVNKERTEALTLIKNSAEGNL